MDSRAAAIDPRQLPVRDTWAVVHRLEAPAEALGFWGSIALPVGYLSLVASGIEGRPELALFLALLSLHLVALVIGHGYRGHPGSTASR